MYRYLLYFLMIFALPAQASKQALVIGNGDYAMLPLVNPVNDATDVASALESLGFEVMLVTNGDKFKMSQAVQQFSKKLKNQDAALFYFSGHGVSGKDQNQNDTNFLVGSFSEHLETGAALINESLNVNFVVRSLKDRNPDGVNIVILDACRNVPPKYLDQNKGTVDEHLVRLSSPQGFIIHYATQPLERAKGDKSSRNSLYTQSLLKALNNPQWVHNSAVDFFNNVGLLVTNNPENPSKQKPSLESSPVDFCFTGCGGVVQQAPVRRNQTARYALVIGNADYRAVTSLHNSKADAEDMTTALGNFKFKVTPLINASKREMDETLVNFYEQVKQQNAAHEVIVYFSGHGLQYEGANYLMPIDANPKSRADIPYMTVNAQQILDKLHEINSMGVNLLILDASFNVPIQLTSSVKGLAGMNPLGSLVLYATTPGKPALSHSEWRNSIYTHYLLEALRDRTKQSLSIFDVQTFVAAAVSRETQQRQFPWQEGALTQTFCFLPPCGTP